MTIVVHVSVLSYLLVPNDFTALTHEGFQTPVWNSVGCCTIPWSRSLYKIVIINQVLHVSWNFELYHDFFWYFGDRAFRFSVVRDINLLFHLFGTSSKLTVGCFGCCVSFGWRLHLASLHISKNATAHSRYISVIPQRHRFCQKWQLWVSRLNFRMCKMRLLMKILWKWKN